SASCEVITKRDFVGSIQKPREVILQADFLQVGSPAEPLNRILDFERVIEDTSDQRCIREQSFIEEVVPSHGNGRVSPTKASVATVERDLIPTTIACDKESVLIACAPVYFCIEVIKIHPIIGIGGLQV